MRTFRQLVVCIAVALASCAGEGGTPISTELPPGSSNEPSTAPSTIPTTPTVTTTAITSPPTSVEPSASTTVPSTTSAAPSTVPSATSVVTSSTVCSSIGGRDEVLSNFPGGLTSLVGVDIRTGAHDCYERIVVEFADGDAPTPAIAPGYWVRYTDDPVTLGQTDDQFVELRGDATLLVTIEAWMYQVDALGRPTEYAGPIDLFPDDVTTIEEIRLIDNWEGVQVWAIGLDRERDLRVTTLTEPQRLVIDVGR